MIIDAKNFHKAITQCQKMDDRAVRLKAEGGILTVQAEDHRLSSLVYCFPIGSSTTEFDVIKEPNAIEKIAKSAKKKGELDISVRGDKLTFKYGNTTKTMKVNNDHNFDLAYLDIGEVSSVNIDGKALKEMVRRAILPIQKNPETHHTSWAFHNAIVVCDEKGRFGFVGSDGKAISRTRWPEPMKGNSLKEWTKTWGGLRLTYSDFELIKTTFDNVTLKVGAHICDERNHIIISNDNVVLTLIEDRDEDYNIPRWDKVFEAKPKSFVKFNGKEFEKATRNANVFASGTEVPITLHLNENEMMTVKAMSVDGKSQTEVPIEWLTQPKEDISAFDKKYLKKLLSRAKGHEIIFGPAKPTSGNGLICWFIIEDNWVYALCPIALLCGNCNEYMASNKGVKCTHCGDFICWRCHKERRAILAYDRTPYCDECIENGRI